MSVGVDNSYRVVGVGVGVGVVVVVVQGQGTLGERLATGQVSGRANATSLHLPGLPTIGRIGHLLYKSRDS